MKTHITSKDFDFNKTSQSKKEIYDIDFDFSKKISPVTYESNNIDLIIFLLGILFIFILFFLLKF